MTTTGSEASSAWTRASRSIPSARRRVAGVVEVHQHEIERIGPDRGQGGVGRLHRVDVDAFGFSSSRSASIRSG